MIATKSWILIFGWLLIAGGVLVEIVLRTRPETTALGADSIEPTMWLSRLAGAAGSSAIPIGCALVFAGLIVRHLRAPGRPEA